MTRAEESRFRLLAVDDEPDIGRLVATVASRVGFEVRTVDNPAAFRAELAAWRPTHVMVDLQMPEADGLELLREIARVPHAPRVMILSGVDTRVLAAARRWASESGLDVAAVLSKPLRLKDLRARLEEIVSRDSALGVDALVDAIEQDQFYLEYQPKIRAADGAMVGVEALLRWNHPLRGRVPPSDFIPMLEQSGLIADLTDWIADAAIAQAGQWHRAGVALHVALNLSAASLDDLTLPDRLEALCRTHGVSPADIVVEVTESAAMADPRAALDILTRLRIKRFELSIDDFGVGYSSMRELRRMPFSELKLDASFLEDGLKSADDAAIVTAIVGLGHGLGMRVVAEGVEDEATLERARDLGCDLLQGYHLGRPMEAAGIAARMAT